MSIFEKYEAVIGVEVHAELNTASKIFCSCSTAFGAAPNTQICPICMGLPGSLPALNKRVVEFAIKAGLATSCMVSCRSYMARKHYFYPDLPKGFQLSQGSMPICRDGYLDITVDGRTSRVGIERIHIEEDAGKLFHVGNDTLVDYNRSGVPLIEVVSRPDIRSGEEAKEFLTCLREILLCIGISDCKMNEGSLRCDVNVSVREKGTDTLGAKVELKNLNSFAFAAKAIDYELERQTQILERGEIIVPQTRRFDEKSGTTVLLRNKESYADYRYLEEPNIPPLCISESDVARIAADIPELPAEKRKKYVEKYGIGANDAQLIAANPAVAKFFEAAAEKTNFARIASNILLTDILSFCSFDDFSAPISSDSLAELASLLGEKLINSSTAKKILRLLTEQTYQNTSPKKLAEELELFQINNEEILRELLRNTKEGFPKIFEDYKNGKTVAKKAIVGNIMAQISGRANPEILEKLLEQELIF